MLLCAQHRDDSEAGAACWDWQPGAKLMDPSWVSLGAPSPAIGAGGAGFSCFREQGALVLSLQGCKKVNQWVSIRWKSSVVYVGCWNTRELIGKRACLSTVASPALSVGGGIMLRCNDKGWTGIGTQLWALLSLGTSPKSWSALCSTGRCLLISFYNQLYQLHPICKNMCKTAFFFFFSKVKA